MAGIGITNLTHPNPWIGVRNKAEYRFRIQKQDPITGLLEYTAATSTDPEFMTVDISAVIVPVDAGDYVRVMFSDAAQAVGIWKVLRVVGTRAVLDMPIISSAPYTSTYHVLFGSRIEPYVFLPQTNSAFASIDSMQPYRMGKILPDRQGYYTVNVAEFLKTVLKPTTEQILTQGIAYWHTPYFLEAKVFPGTTLEGGVSVSETHYALDSMLPNLAPYYGTPPDRLPLSPFGATIPCWPNMATVVSWIRDFGGTTGETVSAKWFPYDVALSYIGLPEDTGEIGAIPVEFVPMPCPKFPNSVQLLWRNPQGGWSTWLFGYRNSYTDEINEEEPYILNRETYRQGVTSRDRIALRSGFIYRPEFAAGLRTLRRSEHVFIVEGSECITTAQDETTCPLNIIKVNPVPGSFFLNDSDTKKFEVDLEIVYALENAT